MRNIGYYFKEGISNMFSHGFMSFAAVGITVACLLIMGTFTLVAYNANENLQDLQRENAVVAFVDDMCDNAEARSLQEKIESIDGIADCTFVSRQEARDDYVAQYDENDLYGELSANVFRHRYVIHIDEERQTGLSEIKTALEAIPGIAKVRADEVITSGFITVRNVARAISLALIAVLLIVSLFIISNTIKLTTFDRREEIVLMRIVGATNGFIRWPFVYEGLLLGLCGAAVAFGLQWLLYWGVQQGISQNDTLQLVSVVDFTQVWYAVAGAYAVAGILIGVGGSLLAIRRFLRV